MPRATQILNTKDVAHILDCSPDDVIYLARRNKLRATKMGRYWRFRYNDIKAYQKKKLDT
jgi:excisionase family DNA binding protein